MYGEWKFRFLAHSLTTFGHESAAKRVPFTLDDTPDKTGLAVVGVARSDAFHLPDRR
ncbi:hypothetical protein WI598_25005 [Salmonella enterica subsp. enterica serovar Corvallis]